MSLIGKIFTGVAGVVGGPVGAVAGAVGGVLGGAKPPKTPPLVPSQTAPFPSTQMPDSVVTRGGGITFGTPFGRAGIGGSKTTTYYSGKNKGQFGQRRYKRINATNPKALRRAIRRIDGFKKIASMVGFTKPPKKMSGVHFKGRKRSCR